MHINHFFGSSHLNISELRHRQLRISACRLLGVEFLLIYNETVNSTLFSAVMNSSGSDGKAGRVCSVCARVGLTGEPVRVGVVSYSCNKYSRSVSLSLRQLVVFKDSDGRIIQPNTSTFCRAQTVQQRTKRA